MKRILVIALAAAWGLPAAAEPPAELAPLLAVGREGKGNAEAAEAWKAAVARGPDALVPLLTALDTANPAAANWLRSAVSAVADAEKSAGRALPAGTLKAFVNDAGRKPAARRIAFELYAKENPAEAADLLAGLVNDPDNDLRRDAIAERLSRAAKLGPKELLAAQKELLPFTRDLDQLDQLAKAVDAAGGPTGEKFNTTAHLNLVTEWQIVGPFDNTDETGLAKPYEPETAKFDPKAEFGGKTGPVAWKSVQSSDAMGKIDLAAELGKIKAAVTYARAVVVAPAAMPAEVRVTSPNAVQIFVNGQKAYERDAYHNGSNTDAHTARVTLNAGENVILVKVAQNDMTQAWAQAWEFSGRLTDATGGRLPLQQKLTNPDGTTEVVALARLKPAPAPEKK